MLDHASPTQLNNKRPNLWQRILLILAVMGPGIITSNVDNDAGGITTYSLAGSDYGIDLLWILVPITIVLIIIQDISARMGVITGKGLAALIRERFGAAITFYLMIGLVLTNLGNTIAEFAGVAAALEIFGVSKILSVPIAALIVWLLVLKAPYQMVERVFLAACICYVAYIISGFMADPDWKQIWISLSQPKINFSPKAITMIIGLIGTTITPWMQFYLQASVIDKGLSFKDYQIIRCDVIIGSISVSIVAFFIILVCAITLNKQGIRIETAQEAALALAPMAGQYAAHLFTFGLLNASLFAASILPLSTAYTVCEAFGWESSINCKFDEAPHFYILYSLMIALGASIVLLLNIPLIGIMYSSQVLNGLVLPIILFFMVNLNRNPKVMGEHKAGRISYILNCLLVIILSFLSLFMVIKSI